MTKLRRGARVRPLKAQEVASDGHRGVFQFHRRGEIQDAQHFLDGELEGKIFRELDDELRLDEGLQDLRRSTEHPENRLQPAEKVIHRSDIVTGEQFLRGPSEELLIGIGDTAVLVLRPGVIPSLFPDFDAKEFAELFVAAVELQD